MVVETDAHMIFECEKWDSVRDEFLGSDMSRVRKEEKGITHDLKLFVTGILNLDPTHTDGRTYIRLEEWIGVLLAKPYGSDDERAAQWNYEVATAGAARFLARVSTKRFRIFGP